MGTNEAFDKLTRKSPESDDLANDTPIRPVIGGLEIHETLGKGAVGRVFKAFEIHMDRWVALKILSPKVARIGNNIKRFEWEAKTLAQFNHPHIVRVISVGKDQGFYYFTMEYVLGPTARKVLKRRGQLAEEAALHIVEETATALGHALSKEITHRDIKPGNIMLDEYARVKLCDLGIGGLLRADPLGGKAPLGTPNYLSPEQARREPNIDFRTDIYSLGVAFYEMVTGTVPFPYSKATQVIKAHLNEFPLDPRDRQAEISDDTAKLIMSMIEKDADDRPQSYPQLIQELRRIQGDSNRAPLPVRTLAQQDRLIKLTEIPPDAPGTDLDD